MAWERIALSGGSKGRGGRGPRLVEDINCIRPPRVPPRVHMSRCVARLWLDD